MNILPLHFANKVAVPAVYPDEPEQDVSIDAYYAREVCFELQEIENIKVGYSLIYISSKLCGAAQWDALGIYGAVNTTVDRWVGMPNSGAYKFLMRLRSISNKSIKTYNYILEMMSNNFQDWSMSFEERGRLAGGVSKEAIEQKEKRMSREIENMNPELARLILTHGGSNKTPPSKGSL